MLMALAAAFALLAPSAAAALSSEGQEAVGQSGVGRIVEIRVNGDAAALARVRMTAPELLLRLDVQPNIKSIDEPDSSPGEPIPMVIAYVDFRSVASPSIDIEDGRTRQELARRRLSDVTSLETGVEAVLHVLYLTVETTLQVSATTPRPGVAPLPKKPVPRLVRRAAPQRTHFGFDFGPLLRMSSLGSTRIVPGGGLGLEPRADFGRTQATLLLSGVLHGTSEISADRGEAEIRPLQIRVVPTLDWLFSPEVSGCVGVGGGMDSFLVSPIQPPDFGRVRSAQSALDPILTGMVGARVPISGRLFLAAMASLDLDLAPTTFVATAGLVNEPILRLPRVRGAFTLALSFTAAGERRFSKADVEP
jgi:hypothetical protein